jgi:hypothetical protein
MSKEKALFILKQYQDHCQTTVNDGDTADIENLKDVNQAIEWAEMQSLNIDSVVLPKGTLCI